MKTTKLLLLALVFAAMAASSAVAQTVTRTTVRPSIARSTNVTASHWNHNRYHRSHSNVYFNFGFGGYPYYGYGWGYPYYGGYPYGSGYYAPYSQRYTAYDRGITDDATVAAVQRRLARGGYYHGAVDGVIGPGTRTAVRAFEQNNGLPVDGVIDPQLLRTMGLS